MDNTSGAYNLTDRVYNLEHKVEQLEVAIKTLWEVIDKLRPKYYGPAKNE